MRKQKGSMPAEVPFGELVHLSHQIRSAGGHRATPGTIRRQRVPGLARNRWLPQCGYNKTNANRGAWGQARSQIVPRAEVFQRQVSSRLRCRFASRGKPFESERSPAIRRNRPVGRPRRTDGGGSSTMTTALFSSPRPRAPRKWSKSSMAPSLARLRGGASRYGGQMR
jgi:hypothetical protein